MSREYELVLIVDTQLEEAEIDASVVKFEGVLTSGGAEIVKIDRWGSRRLAYEIRKRQQGFYVLIYFRAEGELILELERELRLDPTILRYLVVLSDDMPAAAEEPAKEQVEEVVKEQVEEAVEVVKEQVEEAVEEQVLEVVVEPEQDATEEEISTDEEPAAVEEEQSDEHEVEREDG